MRYDFDSYLLYERTPRAGFTVRIRVILKEVVEPEILTTAAVKAFKRYPYYSKTVSVDKHGAYVLDPCDAPIAVFPDDRPVRLGTGETNGLLFAITYSGKDIYFNFSHNFCGACGALFWVKTTLWQYLTDKGYTVSAEGVKLPGTPVMPEETAIPDLASFPSDEQPSVSQQGNSAGVFADFMEMARNPGSMGNFYYPISIEKQELMKYARDNDGSPNSILSVLLFKMAGRVFPDAEQLSGKIICNYRKDVGCPETHCDLVRFLRAIYKPQMKDWSVDRLSTVTRGSMYLQMELEYSRHEYRKLSELRQGIDDQPTLDMKKKYASEHSLLTHAPRDTYTISYVGQIDWGGIGEHIEGVFTITDGHLLLEVNATNDRFCISFQTIRKDDLYLREFLQVLDEEGILYQVGEREDKNLPIVWIV